MNIASIMSTVGLFERKTVAAAHSIILLVRNAYGHIPGDLQHGMAVAKLREAFPSLAKWAAHALIGIVFGWIEKNEPQKLLAITGLIKDDVTAAADGALANVMSFPPSPFAIVQPPTLGEPLPPHSAEPAPIAPQFSSQIQMPQGLRPNAPASSP